MAEDTEAVKYEVGDPVRVVSTNPWCGQSVHGLEVVVTEVHEYPADVVDEGAILYVERVDTEGTTYGGHIPVYPSEVEAR